MCEDANGLCQATREACRVEYLGRATGGQEAVDYTDTHVTYICGLRCKLVVSLKRYSPQRQKCWRDGKSIVRISHENNQ